MQMDGNSHDSMAEIFPLHLARDAPGHFSDLLSPTELRAGGHFPGLLQVGVAWRR